MSFIDMLYSSDIKKQQTSIYWFFMRADGKCTPNEMERFNTICNSNEISDKDKQELIKNCEERLSSSAGSNDIFSIISEIATKMYSGRKSVCAETIWNLINLGYADTSFSELEKAIVNHLVAKWDIDKTTVNIFTDTAETILYLTNQQEWLKTTNGSFDEINSKIADIDRRIEGLIQKIKYQIET